MRVMRVGPAPTTAGSGWSRPRPTPCKTPAGRGLPPGERPDDCGVPGEHRCAHRPRR
jgi:hypothetical protein